MDLGPASVNGRNGLSALSHVELVHNLALVSATTMINHAKVLNLNLATLKIAIKVVVQAMAMYHPCQITQLLLLT
jgi:hypothetical protein